MQEITVAQPQAIRQADSDDHLVAMWLHSKESEHTRRAYSRDIERFRQFVGVGLRELRLSDVQAFKDSLSTYASSTQARILAAVKSLLSFGQELGYLTFNVGAVVKLPKPKNTLAERILTEEQALQMINAPARRRDRVLLRILYSSAARVSEVAGLTWRDVQPNGDSGQVALYGKGGETRVVKLSPATWIELQRLRGQAGPDDPVFVSQKGGALDTSAIWRIVRNAGQAVGIEGVSPHWLRHSHASHALERGASVALVRDTLGHSDAAITSRYLHAKPGDSSALHLVV